MPDPCYVCDECCSGCRDCDECDTYDANVYAKITKENIPGGEGGVGVDCEYGGDFDCYPTGSQFEADWESVTVGPCIGGLQGCDSKTSKLVKVTVCNETNRCVQVFFTFKISGLSKELTKDEDCVGSSDTDCPDENTDCCLLQYKEQSASDTKCNFRGSSFDANGIAPGPGFCIGPCTTQIKCIAMRVVSPEEQCGGKHYSGGDGQYNCCCTEATVTEWCYTIACTDEDECTSPCQEVLSGFYDIECFNCCQCCTPDLADMSGSGFTKIQGDECCDDMLWRLEPWAYRCDQDCNSGKPGFGMSGSGPPNGGSGPGGSGSGSGSGSGAPPNCSGYGTDDAPDNIEFDCSNYDDDQELCNCYLERVESGHPQYITPCVASGNCCEAQGIVYIGSDYTGCPYLDVEEVETMDCSGFNCDTFEDNEDCDR